MLIPAHMTGKRVGILGLGRSGLAAAASLLAAGAKIYGADDSHPTQIPDGGILANWADWPWDGLDLMVISPGIPHHHPEPHPAAKLAMDHGVPVVSEIEIAMMAAPAARIVGITGTNGKSTTTALIGHCLRAAGIDVAVCGNIGDAACQIDDPGTNGVIVMELSSYQLETSPSLATDISVILNITPDHLDRHVGMDGYIAAKTNILHAIKQNGLAVLGAGDDIVQGLSHAPLNAGIITKIATGHDAPASVADCPALAGAHNRENAAAAAIVLRHLGLDEEQISRGIASFKGLAHRLQHVASAGPVIFVNDSKATNGVAAAKALLAFNNIYWIAGGLAKEDGLGAAATALGNVHSAYLIGSSAETFAAALAGHCPANRYDDLGAATRAAFRDACQNKIAATVLLAPAAASFDQFENFAARGEAFTDIARHLAATMLDAQSKGGVHA